MAINVGQKYWQRILAVALKTHISWPLLILYSYRASGVVWPFNLSPTSTCKSVVNIAANTYTSFWRVKTHELRDANGHRALRMNHSGFKTLTLVLHIVIIRATLCDLFADGKIKLFEAQLCVARCIGAALWSRTGSNMTEGAGESQRPTERVCTAALHITTLAQDRGREGGSDWEGAMKGKKSKTTSTWHK